MLVALYERDAGLKNAGRNVGLSVALGRGGGQVDGNAIAQCR